MEVSVERAWVGVVLALGLAAGCGALSGERPEAPPSSSAEDAPPEVIAGKCEIKKNR